MKTRIIHETVIVPYEKCVGRKYIDGTLTVPEASARTYARNKYPFTFLSINKTSFNDDKKVFEVDITREERIISP